MTISRFDLAGGVVVACCLFMSFAFGFERGYKEGKHDGWNECADIHDKLEKGWHWGNGVMGHRILIPPPPKRGPRI
ncbi:MAG TPA: hypothetical protein V6C65_22310 [Allocoleopsis sp.]